MEKKEVCFGEDLRQEKTWELDGITVLHASVTLPQLAATTRTARRFDRYYRHLGKAYFAYCEQMLLPWAKAQCKAALDTSAPWTHTSCEMSYRVTLLEENIVSLFIDAKEVNGPVPRLMLRRAFSSRNYYLSDAGLCFFYPMYAVAPSIEGIVTFTVPYDAERGPFAVSMLPPPERLSIKKEHLLG